MDKQNKQFRLWIMGFTNWKMAFTGKYWFVSNVINHRTNEIV